MILYAITFVLIIGSLIATVLQTVLRGFAGNFKLYYLMRVISTLTIFLATIIGVLFVLCQNLFLFERSDAEMPVAVYYVSNLVYGIIRDRHVTDPKHIVFIVLFLVFAYVFHLLVSHSENPYYKNEEIKKRFYNGAKEFAKEYSLNENGSFDAETYCPITNVSHIMQNPYLVYKIIAPMKGVSIWVTFYLTNRMRLFLANGVIANE